MSRHATAEADDDKRRARRVMAMDEADDAGGGLTAAELAALPDPYAHLRDSSPERAKRNAAAADRTKQPQQLSRRAAPRPQRVSFDEDSDDEADGEDDDEDYEDDEDDEENALRLDDEDEDDDDNDDEENENDDEDASGRGVGDGDAPALISGKRRQGSDAAERARGRAKAWHAGLGLTAAQITAFEELESATFAERQALRDAVGIKTCVFRRVGSVLRSAEMGFVCFVY